MFKLLAMLLTFLLVGLTLLGLRQHRLELTSKSAAIFAEIQNKEDKIRGQQVDIARETNPWTILAALKQAGINTGDAMQTRSQGASGPTVPAIETDLVAPLLDTPHTPARPRGQ